MELKQSGYFLARTLSYEASHLLMYLSKHLHRHHPTALPPTDLLGRCCKHTEVNPVPDKKLRLLSLAAT